MSLRSQKVDVEEKIDTVGADKDKVSKVASSTPAKGNGDAKEQDDDDESIDWTAKLVEELSGLYGYAILGSGITVSYVVGISELPFTIWNGDSGKPEANATVM